MKASTLGALMGAALFAACFVERPSQSYECSTTADCARFGDNRVCESGYCVVANCPSDCTSCNEATKACTMTCTSADNCGNVTCPTGWNCTITCTGSDACSNVTCAGDSQCSVTCTGTNACNQIRCSNACQCDVTCIGGACGMNSCPTGAMNTPCTMDGTTGTTCDSSRQGCAKC